MGGWIGNGQFALLRNGKYHLWFSMLRFRQGKPDGGIGYATSKDGVRWRKLDHPILVPDTSQQSEAQGWFPGTAAIYQGSRTLLYWPAIAMTASR